jgi:hypothetical protein
MVFIFGFTRRIEMKNETRQEISAAFAKDYTDWMVKTGGYAKDMTLRDHFAGLALKILSDEWEDHPSWDLKYITDSAYRMADAMLKERSK